MILPAIFVLTVSTTLITLMAVFLGSESSALNIAMQIQAVIGVIATCALFYYTWRTLHGSNLSQLIALYRRSVPGWGWFVFWSISSLMIAGELAFAVTRWANVENTPWLNHAPLLSGLMCTCATVAIFVASKKSTFL